LSQVAVPDVTAQLLEAERRYVERNPESRRLHEERARYMPGGNTRTVIHVEPFPLTVVRGEGARLVDADGHEYVDFLGEYTAGLYGHSHPAVLKAIRDALDDGIALGAPNRYETELAAALCDRFPSVELVRFCNSGTEANLLALSLARAVSERPAIMVFGGGYHGSVFFFEAAAGSPLNAPFPFVVAQYNDAAGAARLIAEHAHELAAVVVEPLQGSGGVIPGEPAFLQALRDATAAHDVLLVFDEVMTSRLSTGGLQHVLGITPDLTTFGKYLGGGLAFGAFGGRADLMSRFDPSRRGALPHAGTFNNAVLTMAAGAAGLRVYGEDEVARLNGLGDRLRDRLNAFAAEHAVDLCATGYGSLVGMHLAPGPIRSRADVPVRGELQALLHLRLLEQGYSYARRGFVALSLPVGERDVDGFAAAVEGFFDGVIRTGGVS
jgi:glutamate-1-semialdehyde 2,1-aminomutase